MDIRTILYNCYTLILLAFALFIAIGCKDFEDCRAIYTNIAYIEINSKEELNISEVKFSAPHTYILYDSLNIKEGKFTLNRLPIPLHPHHTRVELLFYKEDTALISALDPVPDTLTIFYRVHAGMLSPQCGLHQAYILDSLETSFAEATIIKPTLRTKDYEKSNEEEAKNPNVKIRY
jgi:hypothetical protein